MSVQVEEQWRYKRVKSEVASKSAFAYKINIRLRAKGHSRAVLGFSTCVPYSREVVVKITGGSRGKKEIRGAVDYISRGWTEEILDSNGLRYRGKEDTEGAVAILQHNVIEKLNSIKREKLTHNVVFSAPKIAEVGREDALKAVGHVLREKYPDNYFVMAYHDETENSHVHVVLNIHQDTGKKINIRKKDLRDLREGFAKTLIDYGYDVKATRKYGYKPLELEEPSLRENRNAYEVIDFGTASYQFDLRNDKSCYLIYKTFHNQEVTIWGKDLLDELGRHDIRAGDFVRIKKSGQVDIKVPVYGDDQKTILSWMETKRNQWRIEKVGDDFKALDTDSLEEIRLDSPERAERQLAQRERFDREKQIVLGLSSERQWGLESELRHKPPSHSL